MIQRPGCHAKELRFYLADDSLPLKTLSGGRFLY